MVAIIYTPPTLTKEEGESVKKDLENWMRSSGVVNSPKLALLLAIENAQMVKEINDLRHQLGIQERPTYFLNHQVDRKKVH